MPAIGRPPATRLFAAVALVIALATAVGMAVLWPGDVGTKVGESLVADSERATVERVEELACPRSLRGGTCGKVTARLESGPDKGRTARFQLGGGGVDPDVDVGDEVRLVENVRPPGVEALPGQQYSLSDFERRRPMLFLALVFAVLVVLFARLRGVLSLAGLAISLAVVLVFMVPAILDGKSPLAVAVVGSLAVMLATITLAHGTGPKSLAAILGTAASLLLTVGLAVVFTELTHLTGLSSEEAAFRARPRPGSRSTGCCWRGSSSGRSACSTTSRSARPPRCSRCAAPTQPNASFSCSDAR